ncbi:unnamed protein product [Cylindrotheca closterium]|uniref:Plastid lipid-associated protein/fibrillin conserved domain-containing protein n=1 Tax=Cylindrotheca closterium TaxID=2856 RepID=A0AAD2CRX1_9STRA|nr:unnamed protein product [Cylindrotheca closterium]
MVQFHLIPFTCFLSMQLALSGDVVSAFSVPKQTTLTTRHQNVKRDATSPINSKQSSFSKSDSESSRVIASFLLGATLSFMGMVSQPLPSVAASTTIMDPMPGDVQGVGAVTQSKLGQSVRGAVIGGAQIADSLDLQWERFSDKLRDESKCDPRTNRRMFDNGTRRDGTKIGNPVLGALCTPEPLKAVDDSVVAVVTKLAEDAMLEISNLDRSKLKEAEQRVADKVRPAFARAAASTSSIETSNSADADPELVQKQKRQEFNRDLYVQMRTYGEVLTFQSSASTPKSKSSVISQQFETSWGRKMLQELAPNANRKDYSSPFPKPDPTDEQPYDEASLLDALGGISVVLNKLQAAGIVGHWEISIPEDDFWNVVTIAVDDDVSIGGEILARESKLPLSGSPVVGLVKAAMEGTRIPYKIDTFFIDPTTTKQELYNPSQLLVSLGDLGQ